MDINKEIDRLDRAVKRGDVDEAIEIDTNLAVYENNIRNGLITMPKEHAETMSFYFRDWFMNMFDELIFIAMIVIAFRVENELLAILLGAVGAFFLVGKFLGRRKYVQFLSNDIWRMRNEKVFANNFKLQLNHIQKSRAEHDAFLMKARQERDGGDLLSKLFNMDIDNSNNAQAQDNEDERQEDTEPPKDK